jgi:hypothetical protein
MENPIIITTDIARFVSAAEDLQREIFNREQDGVHNETLMSGAPLEWVEEQRKHLEERNKPYSNRPCVIVG